MKNTLHYYFKSCAALFLFLGVLAAEKVNAQTCTAKYGFTVSDLKVSFTDSSTTANAYRRLWTFGDGTSSDAKNPVHTYKASGSYRVCLIIKDSVNYCMDTFCETVKVKAACFSNFNFSVSGKTVTYTADTSHNKSTAKYTWRVENGVFKTGKSLTYTYANEGKYEVCLTVNDSPCISKACKIVTIGCHAKFSFKANGLSVAFTDLSTSSSTTGGLVRAWTFGNGKKSDGKNPSITYDSAGSYRVCLVIKDTVAKCIDTFCETVKVEVPCTSNFTYSISGKTVTFTADTTHNKSTAKYTWRVENGVFKTGKSLTYTYANEGNYEVCLTVNDSPCISKACKVVTIGCHAKFSFKTNGLAVSFTDFSTSSSTTGGLVRSWTFGDGHKSDGKNPIHTYDSAGSYRVCLVIKDTIAKCIDTFCETVKVNNCASNFTFKVKDSTVTLIADTTHHKSTAKYNWRVESGVFKTGKIITYKYSKPGNYEVCLTVVDSPCEVKTCKVVTIGHSGYRISGHIYAGKDTAYPGRVWLIVYQAKDTVLKTIKQAKITKTSAGTGYLFENVPAGTYYVKASLDTSSSSYSNYIPTYHDSAIKWANASKITVTTANITGKDIYMVKGTNPGGKGFIAGKISQGANKKEGDPVSDVEIMLLDANGNPVAYRYSDINGEYSFSDLVFGTYQVYAEVAGLETFPAIVTISETNPRNDNIQIKVNSSNIVTAIRPKSFTADNSGLHVYPNPANTFLNIKLKDIKPQPVQVIVYSITGKQLLNTTQNVNGIPLQVPVSDLSNGMYILEVKLQNSQSIMRTRFTKAN